MKKNIIFIFIFLLLLSASCNKETENNNTNSQTNNEQVNKNDNSKKMLFSKSNDEISGELTINTEVIKKMEPVNIEFRLMNRAGEYIKDASVTIDLIMPSMKMPKNLVKLKQEDNIYKGEAIFTMKGEWRIIAQIEKDNEKKELNFDLVVK